MPATVAPRLSFPLPTAPAAASARPLSPGLGASALKAARAIGPPPRMGALWGPPGPPGAGA
eukprot:15477622-Alexandrium_andersonii.AAC.1